MSWYYVANGQQAGPVEDAELQDLISAGKVMRETLVWRPGMDNWLPLANVTGMAPVAAAQATQRCLQCHRMFPPEEVIELAGGRVCGQCKPLVLQKLREGHSIAIQVKRFAGFWIRFVARMIDGTITTIISYILQIPMFIILGALSAGRREPDIGFTLGLTGLTMLLSIGAVLVYEAWFLVHKGGTPGKLILGLQVIRGKGGKITWGLAIGRYFAHMVSSLTLYIGYLMAAWDEEKRALHDHICDTRVVHGS